MENKPKKSDYGFYLSEHGMTASQTDEYFKNWKGSRSLASFKQHKNIEPVSTKRLKSLLRRFVPDPRAKVKDMYK